MELLCYFCLLLLGSIFSTIKGLRVEEINGGEEAKENQFKSVVAIMYDSEEEDVDDPSPCAGNIIDDWHVITVAHCFFDEETGKLLSKKFYIILSTADLNNYTKSSSYRKIDLVIMHSTFVSSGVNGAGKPGNIALSKVDFPFGLRKGHPNLKKLNIPHRATQENEVFIVASYGWNTIVLLIDIDEQGKTSYITTGYTDGKLRFARAKILGYDDCYGIYPDITDGNMCVKLIQNVHERKGICKGDSGAPLFTNRTLFGLAINGYDECNENKAPGIYIDIRAFRSFIESALKKQYDSAMHVFRIKEHLSNQFRFERIH